MAITLPLPFRVAAGILGTGIDLVRSLPDDIPALPVTLVGNAMKLSIKVQQEIATLATRGDELLGGVIGGAGGEPRLGEVRRRRRPVQPVRPVSKLKTAPAAPGKVRQSERPREPTALDRRSPAEEPRRSRSARADQPDPQPNPTADDAPTLTTPDASSMPPVITTAMDAAIEVAGRGDRGGPGRRRRMPPRRTAATLDEAVDADVAAEVTEALEEAIALEVAAEVTEALEDAVALEVAAEVDRGAGRRGCAGPRRRSRRGRGGRRVRRRRRPIDRQRLPHRRPTTLTDRRRTDRRRTMTASTDPRTSRRTRWSSRKPTS